MRSRHAVMAGAAALIVALGAPAAAEAQTPYRNAVSANPFGILLELFNGEYERVVGESSTAGVGGSFFSRDDVDYLNADVFYRFYPAGTPLEGWSFGAKVGLTNVPDDVYFDPETGTERDADGSAYFGIGFDLNRSWLLGKRNNFYVGVGFGLKRLYGVPDEYNIIDYVPTFRIVNVGFAF